MALDFGGNLFPASEEEDLGLNNRGTEAFWSCSGSNFHGRNPDVDNITYGAGDFGNVVLASVDGIFMIAPISLPQGAVITSAIVFGDAAASAETWTLGRTTLSPTAIGQDVVATANINTKADTNANALIDNSKYAYNFITSTIDTNDEIRGAIITYTT